MTVAVQYPIGGRTASAVAESVETGIREGRLAPGATLPTVRDLARTLGVSPATVAGAYRALRARGLVSAQGRRGTRVSPRPPLPTRSPAPIPHHLRNAADGNPDPDLLPLLGAALARIDRRPRLYGGPSRSPELVRLAAAQLDADGIDARHLAVLGGALDGIERVLQAHLRAGDRVAVEDPGYTGVLDIVGALGFVTEPVGVDDSGPLPGDLERALRAGAEAFVLTPRAQNPTGAALDERRARELRRVLDGHRDVLVVEDDHAGPVAGARALSVCQRQARWAVVRSVSKSLGPDLRVAVLAGDSATVARVEGRQMVGTGWVSRILQEVVATLWADAATERRLAAASAAYSARRADLVDALAAQGIRAHGRSGFNVWIPVAEESRTVSALAAAGWAVRPGERYRIKSPPAIRVTISTLGRRDAQRFAAGLARSLEAESRTQFA